MAINPLRTKANIKRFKTLNTTATYLVTSRHVQNLFKKRGAEPKWGFVLIQFVLKLSLSQPLRRISADSQGRRERERERES
jgi:hypothetical protein